MTGRIGAARSRARVPGHGGQGGFTIVEILIGFFVLSIAFVSLGAYTSSQRSGLYKSSQLSDGTQVASYYLEEMKRELSDSAKYKNYYDQIKSGPVILNKTRKMNNIDYKTVITLTHGPALDCLIKVRAKTTWKKTHTVEFGVLVTGASTVL